MNIASKVKQFSFSFVLSTVVFIASKCVQQYIETEFGLDIDEFKCLFDRILEETNGGTWLLNSDNVTSIVKELFINSTWLFQVCDSERYNIIILVILLLLFVY